MKSLKKIIIFGSVLSAGILMGSCEKQNDIPDLTPVKADYVMPAPTVLTPEQTEIKRQIVAEYDEATAD